MPGIEYTAGSGRQYVSERREACTAFGVPERESANGSFEAVGSEESALGKDHDRRRGVNISADGADHADCLGAVVARDEHGPGSGVDEVEPGVGE